MRGRPFLERGMDSPWDEITFEEWEISGDGRINGDNTVSGGRIFEDNDGRISGDTIVSGDNGKLRSEASTAMVELTVKQDIKSHNRQQEIINAVVPIIKWI